MLCEDLKGWDGVGSGREVQDGGDMSVPMADSCVRNPGLPREEH